MTELISWFVSRHMLITGLHNKNTHTHTDNLDFKSATRTVTFATDDKVCVEFDVINDGISPEDREQFSVSFRLPADVQIGVIPTATVTIIDSDGERIMRIDAKNVIGVNYTWYTCQAKAIISISPSQLLPFSLSSLSSFPPLLQTDTLY